MKTSTGYDHIQRDAAPAIHAKPRRPSINITPGERVARILLGAATVTFGIVLLTAAGSVIVLMVWIYFSMQIFLFGAEFTHEYAKK